MRNAQSAAGKTDRMAGRGAWLKILVTMAMLLMNATSRGQAKKGPVFKPELRPAIAHMSWTQRDGAPAHIAALAETTDGYLWIGSPLGLYRFDGVQFAGYPLTPLDAPLPSSDVESLAGDQHGGLWIGFRLGGISYLSHDGTVTNYNRRNGRGPGEVQKLLCRSDGSVWALGDGRLIVLQNGEWQNFGINHGLPQDELYTFYFDRAGELWTAAREKVFVLRKAATTFVTYEMKSFAVVDFAETTDGQLWVSDAWHSVHPLKQSSAHEAIDTRGLARIVIEPSGTIWMAQDYRGVSHGSTLDAGDTVKETAASEQTEAILRDLNGNIWVGSSLGLDRFQPTVLQSLGGFRLEYYPSLAADPQGGAWVATHEHALLHVDAGIATPMGPPVGSSPVVCDQQGHLWLVDPVLHDLVEYNRSKIFKRPNPPETNLMVAQSIGLDLDGSPLVDFLTKGLWRYDGAWHRINDPVLPKDDVLAILRDSEGQIWLGFADGLIVMRDALGFHAFPVNRGADIGNVLAFASLQGRIWAGGTDGVAYFDGHVFHKLVLRNGIPLRGVSGIVEDKSHDLWFNARAGIVRIEAGEVQKALVHSETPLGFDVVDERHGLSGSATQLKPTPSAIAESDGTLVFSTDGNVFFLDPTKILFHHAAPRVMLETVAVNGSAVVDREHMLSQIQVNAGSLSGLEIDYIGIDLTAPEKVIYKYMLVGEDTAWQDAGTRRQAFYRHLSPGKYTFRVAAASGDEVVTELTLPLVLTVTPAFYQTKWFIAICLLAALSLLYAAYLMRMQYVTNGLKERLKERSSERIRIARELHDTLLQSIHGLMLRFHFATEALPEDEPVRKSLQVALSRADEVILEGRRRVQDLREEVSDVVDFASQIASLATDLDIQRVMEFYVTENGEPMELDVGVRGELCKVAREALTNMLRHSGAKRAEIALTYDGDEFMMKCCDNGVGLAPAILSDGKRQGHWGLVGMRERISTIEGTLQLWSSPGCGTEIEIRIPGRKAYRYSSVPSKWFQRLSQLRRNAEGDGRVDY
jgi:signal transduction histidine kinase/ligand-binding sensor domain-containing protein